MATGSTASEEGYAAFISYRHLDPDRTWATWLHGAMETYRVPKQLRRERNLPARVGRVFRDEDELPASHHLGEEIEKALQASRFLVVVCSPRTPESKWVNKEVERFREHGRGDRILALLIEGAPSESFPVSLREIRTTITDDAGNLHEEIEDREPLAADVRDLRNESPRHLRRMALLRILAPLLGVRFDDLRRRDQERQRRRALFTSGILAALVVVLAGLAWFAFDQRSAARQERDAKAEALDRVLRLADAKKVRDLLDEEDTLWPVHPDTMKSMVAWITRAEEVIENRAGHEDAREELRARASSDAAPWHFDSDEDAWRHQVLSDLLDDLDRLAGAQDDAGALGRVRLRLASCASLRADSIERHRDAWRATIAAVAASDKYDGLALHPQLGLVPLGPDPDSGLFEFAHVGSGSVPTRDPQTHRLLQAEDAAIVLVLLPGGTFLAGAQRKDEGAPNYDAMAGRGESDARGQAMATTLTPFFLSKYECTQAQWQALTGGQNPSGHRAGTTKGGVRLTLRNPVESVSWEQVHGTPGWLVRHRLTLPSEAQWEYACRAGTTTPWYSGRDVTRLGTIANIADAHLKSHGGANFKVTPEVDDGHAVHAPVGSFAANDFGLHDVHGNVFEWCLDAHKPTGARAPLDPVNEGPGDRVARGGSWSFPARDARASYRYGGAKTFAINGLGVRPARAITH